MPLHKVTAATVLATAVILTGGSLPAGAQSSPLSNVVVAGFGTVNYRGATSGEFVNDFSASVSPILLYSMGDDILFETELEFELEDDVTETSLEYAQLDYLGFERVQITAGKFLLPFGVFSERLHPSWINKMPSLPAVYGHAHGGVAEDAIVPVLSDAGLMVRTKQPIGESWAFDASGWISQGPVLVAHDEGEEDHADKTGDEADALEPEQLEIAAVGFGVGFSDNNENKMVGARLGVVHGGTFEFYASGFHAMYDPAGLLDIEGLNVAAELRQGPVEVRGEGVFVRQQFALEDGGNEWLENKGYYLQAARRFGSFEPVVRWGHLLESKVQGELVRGERRMIALGLDYWIAPSIPVKLAYEIDLDGTDRILLQWAYGF